MIMSFALMLLFACVTNKKAKNDPIDNTQIGADTSIASQFMSGPPVMVYKTKSNYYNLVPIILNDEKTEIVSYPHPTDLTVGNRYALPTVLSNEYLLDNRGINKNVAFIKMTYEEYSKLKNAPTLKELNDLIIDRNPLTELCDCGSKNRFIDIQKELNELIKNNSLKNKCKMIK